MDQNITLQTSDIQNTYRSLLIRRKYTIWHKGQRFVLLKSLILFIGCEADIDIAFCHFYSNVSDVTLRLFVYQFLYECTLCVVS